MNIICFFKNMKYNSKIRTDIFALLLSILMIFSLSVTCFASSNDYSRETVRVGYLKYDGFNNSLESGEKSGYGYDILQKLRIYENFNYEYIGYDENISWNDMLKKLEKGDIDLLAPVGYSKERENLFDYSTLPIGYNSTVIYIKANNKKYSTIDFRNWNNISVGLITSNIKNDSFDKYAKDHCFTYSAHYCNTPDELNEMLQNSTVDIVISSNMQTLSNAWVVDEFDKENVYYTVKKGNKELLDKINDGLSKLAKSEPNFQDNLNQKYYENNIGESVQFSNDEQDYIDNAVKSNKTYYAIINPNRKPLSYYENKAIKGLLSDISKEIFSRTGLNIKILNIDSREKYYDAIDNKKTDIICDYTGNASKAENNNLVYLDTYYTSTTSRLARRDFDGNGNRCAVAGSSISGWLQGQGYDFVYVNSVEDCCKAVKNGDADFTFSYTKCIQDMVYDDETNSLMALTDNHQSTDFAMAVTSSSDALLCSILKKCIDSVSSDDISNIADSYTYYDKNNTSIKTIMYRNPVIFGIIIFVVATLVFGIIILILILRRKNIEYENSEKLKKALDASELATKEKNEFYSRMSHDMRTPMNGILGISRLSLNENDSDVLKENMRKIYDSGEYLLGLINDTLDLQRIESGKLNFETKVVLAKEFITNGTESIKQMAKEKDVDFKIVTSSVDYNNYIKIDPMRVQQIFINLLSNAVKFTPSGGTVKLEINVLKPEGNLVHSRVIITDTGLGMSEEFIKNKMYEPFSQEHNKLTDTYAGSGLGLSIVKNLVDMMGAKISVESELGVGTKFTIDFDVEIVDKKDVVQKEKLQTQDKNTIMDKLNGKNILLAEDHPLNAEIVKKLLEKVKCNVVWTKNGLECVEEFKNSEPKQFDLILMDIRMPIMDGITATKRIRETNHPNAKAIPIIALTANAYEDDIKASINAGMNEHLSKPIEIQKFYMMLVEYIK